MVPKYSKKRGYFFFANKYCWLGGWYGFVTASVKVYGLKPESGEECWSFLQVFVDFLENGPGVYLAVIDSLHIMQNQRLCIRMVT